MRKTEKEKKGERKKEKNGKIMMKNHAPIKRTKTREYVLIVTRTFVHVHSDSARKPHAYTHTYAIYSYITDTHIYI